MNTPRAVGERPLSTSAVAKRHVAAQQFDIRIASDGRWFHEGDEIRRFELVKLFASILVLDDKGDYWLATPAEKGRITVDDAPFIIRDLTVKTGARSRQNEICFQTNIDETVFAKRAVRSIKKRGLVGKLMNSFTGPREIIRKLAGSSYEMKHCDTGKSGKRHAAHISPFLRELLPFIPISTCGVHT